MKIFFFVHQPTVAVIFWLNALGDTTVTYQLDIVTTSEARFNLRIGEMLSAPSRKKVCKDLRFKFTGLATMFMGAGLEDDADGCGSLFIAAVEELRQ